MSIPKVIYICHKEIDKIQIYSQRWKQLNPEYEISLFDDEMCRQFFQEEYPPIFLKIFDYIQDGPIKADFWRICIINKYGGLYVDADIEPLVPLRYYIDESDDFVTCISTNFNKNVKKFQLNPHFILSNKNNNILEKCIQKYIMFYQNRNKYFFQYSYWGWSICRFLHIPFINEKKSQIIYLLNGNKVKLLLETPDMNHCEYNGVIVLNNRYNIYKNHNFVN